MDYSFTNIVPKESLRKVQLNTLETLASVLSRTAGPRGSNTQLIHSKRHNEYTKDGHNVLSEIKFYRPLENAIQSEMKEITRYIVKTVGDGTTSAVLLSNEIFKAMCEAETSMSAYSVMKTFKEIVDEMIKQIRANKRECTLEDIYDICMIATNGNKEVSSSIQNIYKEFGMDVFIDVGISNTTDHLVKSYDGLTLNVGYPTPAYCSDRKEIDIRTGADFNVRIAMFLLEAGCEDIIYYCLYDRTGALNGSSAWNEMYFGACYNYDYYGVYMPKPWAAAFAQLTRIMDGYKKVSFFDKYEENEFGTLRAFTVEKEDGEFAVLWSNIYQQPNTSVSGRVDRVERIPAPAWESRWVETETREFDAVGDTVRVVDIMGNETVVKAENGKVKLELSGSPIYVYGIC